MNMNTRIVSTLGAISLALLPVACDKGPSASAPPPTTAAATQADGHGGTVHEAADHGHAAGPPHWSYAGESGPSHWGALAPEYALCAAGHNQSPINITTTVAKDLPNIDFHYRPMPVEVVNNGHTVQVNCPAG